MSEPKILPFYMTYPMRVGDIENKNMVRDLEFFQQLYPQGAKRLLTEIVKSMDLFDYEGSMIYDEYPDLLSLRQMTKSILEKIRKLDIVTKNEDEELIALLQCDQIEDYCQILTMNEILKRRHKNDRGYILF